MAHGGGILIKETLLIVVTAFVFAAGATPLARRLAWRLRLLDNPTPRKDHLKPMPLLGGLALWISVLGSLLLLGNRQVLVEAWGILAGATAVSFLGLWDDRRALPLSFKLVGQALAVSILLIGGLQVRLPVAPWGNLAITFLWVLALTNAFNLLDNMDGLSGGVGAVAAAGLLVLAGMNGQYLVAILAAATLGACLGFLLYNFSPARIFMGDSGSLFLGFLLAVVGIKLRFPDNIPQVTWIVPILVFLVPICDTLLVVFSRLRKGKNPLTSPGQDHISHRLVRMGLSRRQAVVLLYGLGVMLVVVAVFVSRAERSLAYAVAAGIAIAATAALAYLEAASARASR